MEKRREESTGLNLKQGVKDRCSVQGGNHGVNTSERDPACQHSGESGFILYKHNDMNCCRRDERLQASGCGCINTKVKLAFKGQDTEGAVTAHLSGQSSARTLHAFCPRPMTLPGPAYFSLAPPFSVQLK